LDNFRLYVWIKDEFGEEGMIKKIRRIPILQRKFKGTEFKPDYIN